MTSTGVLPGGIEVRLSGSPDGLTFDADVPFGEPIVKNGTATWTLAAPPRPSMRST